MGKQVTIFALSDVHGHYKYTIEALKQAGYDKECADHLLLCCGDYFDRGNENREVLRFFERIPNCVLLRGNHEDLLLKVIYTGKFLSHNYINGTRQTIENFFGKYALDTERGYVDFSGHNREVDRIIDFINGTKNYFETKNNIFVHGWLPTVTVGEEIFLKEDWRNASDEEWEAARWGKWNKMYKKGVLPTDKTVVCGHVPTFYANEFDESRTSEDSSVYEAKGLIVLDAGTFTSKRVNVLKIEDELL